MYLCNIQSCIISDIVLSTRFKTYIYVTYGNKFRNDSVCYLHRIHELVQSNQT